MKAPRDPRQPAEVLGDAPPSSRASPVRRRPDRRAGTRRCRRPAGMPASRSAPPVPRTSSKASTTVGGPPSISAEAAHCRVDEHAVACAETHVPERGGDLLPSDSGRVGPPAKPVAEPAHVLPARPERAHDRGRQKRKQAGPSASAQVTGRSGSLDSPAVARSAQAALVALAITCLALVGGAAAFTKAVQPRPPLHLSPGGSDSGRCTRAAARAGASTRAYRLARPGQHGHRRRRQVRRPAGDHARPRQDLRAGRDSSAPREARGSSSSRWTSSGSTSSSAACASSGTSTSSAAPTT